jgi:peptidoglycan hydrolase-like protein with peptidoglycan-binding domain
MSRITGLNLKRFDNFSTIVPKANPYPEPTTNIKFGSRGDGVKWLQWELNDKDHCGLKIDGIAGSITISCLTEYQMHNDLVPDGICGPLTRASLKLSS